MHRPFLMNMTTSVPFSFFCRCHFYLVCCLILFQFCLSDKISDHVLCLKSEREALLTFKHGLVDEAHRLASWVPENKDCCKWVGIACDNSTGHVHQIHLRALDGHCNILSFADSTTKSINENQEALKQRLRGGISSSLLDLKQLKHLDLSCNDFEQIKVPKFIGSFAKLNYLNLSSSNFYGVIPPQLGNLSELQTLCLGSLFSMSEDTSIINMQWLSNLGMLHHLDLSGVDLHDATNWLQVINTLPSLVQLHMRDCGLTDIHPEVPSLNITSLSFLDLSSNNFSSSVPRWIFTITSLVSLDIYECYFHSIIPSNIYSFRNLTSLRFLHTPHNDFMHSSLTMEELSGSNLIMLDMSDCGVSSSVLEFLHNLTSLHVLELSYNQLTKMIPRSLGNICNLRELGLSGNNIRNISLAYLLESFFECKSPSLNSLDLSFNNIDGTIPHLIQKFSFLRELDISKNQISGLIPYSIGQLSSLESLLIVFNQLNGPIPYSIGKLSSLEALQLSDNQLNGPIPYSIGQLSSLKALCLHNNQLNGPIPYSIGQLSSLETLYIDYNQLNGSFPESIGQLSKLTDLRFSYNMLTGIVTEAHFAKLVNLECLYGEGNNKLILNLQDVNWIPPFQLTDLYLKSWVLGPQFPLWIQSQIDLRYLDISNTSISSPIPESFFSSFRYLESVDISHNHIRGMLMLSSIPTTPLVVDISFNQLEGSLHHFFCSSGLEVQVILNLGNNHLSGTIPNCLEKFTFLSNLNMENNNLSGEIPRTLGSLSNLMFLNMHGNKITGRLPTSLMNLTSLVVLQLGKNDLYGSIPTWIGKKLTDLRILNLRFNKFDGNIPSEICYLIFVQILDLSHNNLTGNIPRCFNYFKVLSGSGNIQLFAFNFHVYVGDNSVVADSLVTKGREDDYESILQLVTLLDLSSNNLVGPIPVELTSLPKLKSLNLSRNQLTGRIPKGIGEIIELESLDLSLNKLSGELPTSMSKLNFLSYFNVSYNNLVGRIPTGTQIQSFDKSSFLGNKLEGPPLTEECCVPVEVTEDAKQMKDDGRDWGWIISMVLGFVAGFWMVVGTLILKRSWRIAYFEYLSKLRYMFYDVMHKCCLHASF